MFRNKLLISRLWRIHFELLIDILIEAYTILAAAAAVAWGI